MYKSDPFISWGFVQVIHIKSFAKGENANGENSGALGTVCKKLLCIMITKLKVFCKSLSKLLVYLKSPSKVPVHSKLLSTLIPVH